MKLIVLLAVALVLSLDARGGKIDRAWEGRHVLAVLEIIDVRDGIDATEARALAEAYFVNAEGFDGGLWSFKRDGDWWVFETLVGPNGVSGEPIRIHVEKGWITKKGGELVRPPWKKLRSWYSDLLEAAKAESGRR
ncbi:hypothetical protein V2O64_19215 [Verrucomicrobiaceae bacterium 227]